MKKFKVIEHDNLLFFYNWTQVLPDFEHYSIMLHYYAEMIVDTSTGEVLKNRYGIPGENFSPVKAKCCWCNGDGTNVYHCSDGGFQRACDYHYSVFFGKS